MLKYVAKTLHTEITRHPFDFEGDTDGNSKGNSECSPPLPLYLKELFAYEKWSVFGAEFLVATPQENLAVKTLAKHEAKLKASYGLPVAFGYRGTTKYRAARMIEAGLPFIVDGGQLYLPFLGVVLSKKRKINSLPKALGADKASAQTQRFILKVIYEGITDLSVTQAAELLDVAKITASRIYDELEAIDPVWIAIDGRVRRFVCEPDQSAFWRKAEPHLFNPVVREYRLDHIPPFGHLPLSGISAISHHSMLADGPCPTFAITKAQEQELGLKSGKGLAGWDQWDEPACVIQVMRYRLDSMEDAAIDPLSAILSLSEDDKDDVRIERETERIIMGVFGQQA